MPLKSILCWRLPTARYLGAMRWLDTLLIRRVTCTPPQFMNTPKLRNGWSLLPPKLIEAYKAGSIQRLVWLLATLIIVWKCASMWCSNPSAFLTLISPQTDLV